MPNAAVHATIRTDCLRHNVRVLHDRARPAGLMAVLKADAYGHGVRTVAPLLQEAGVKAFAVARLHEAITLRQLGIEGLILVLAPPTPDELPAYTSHRLHASVTSVPVARMLTTAPLDGRLPVHVNVDTGMHRLGLNDADVPMWWKHLHQSSSVEAAGVYTHLATADTPDHPLNATQLEHFAEVVRALHPAPTTVHVANTDALSHLPARLPSGAQYARVGLGLYGLTSSPAPDATPNDIRNALRPVLSLRARVIHTHTVPEGETVSYGARWTAPRATQVATLSIGYGDGYPRAASGHAHVRLHDTLRPMVGRVCMDLCMVDLGSPTSALAQHTSVGDHAVLFDAVGPTLHDVARWSDTIPYEIACQLAPRVPRHYCDAPATSVADNGTI